MRRRDASKRLERECATEAEKMQLLFAERLETSWTASRQLAEGEESLQWLQSKIVAVTAEMDKWRELATETAEKRKVAQSDPAL